MEKIIVLLTLLVLMSGLTNGATAYTINYSNTGTGGQYTTPYLAGPGVANLTVETFDPQTQPLNWTWDGNYSVVTGSQSGLYAAPAGGLSVSDPSRYVTTPKQLGASPGNYVTVTNLGGTYNYFGLWWGSVDGYNTLTFYKNGQLVQSFTGNEAINPSHANGDQTASSTNLYINFLNLPEFDSFRLASTNYAFEADNIAVGNVAPVPEPGTVLLLGLGLFGLAIYGKRRMNREAL